MLSPAEEDVEVEVSRDDQSRINEFGRLNARKHEIRDEIAEAEKRKGDLEDAEESVYLDSGAPGGIKVMVGEAFVDVDGDTAQEVIADFRQKENDKIEAYKAELTKIEARQGELKTLLYGKFGKTINLEE